jgi:asparagine synthase (glutamine-hydrolysing)
VCGISALIWNPDLHSSSIQAFNSAVSHRGMDGEGLKIFPISNSKWKVALAHRRLSIIDLSDMGGQPMTYGKSGIWITFNGEIYNYIEIKAELQALGYSFVSSSDTEVIVAAYLQWGVSSFQKLRGMWGFVLHDINKRKLIACRDRLGIKPLYYFHHASYISFGSEIKQFLTLPDFIARPNREVVRQYLLTGFELTDRTFFESIHPVLPGTYVQVEYDSLKVSEPTSFWSPEKIKPVVTNQNEAVDLFGKALAESIRLHLRSDVPIGCQLSGGLDSSAIYRLMTDYYEGSKIHCFTIQFPGYEKNEAPFVNKVLTGSKAASHFITPNPNAFLDDLQRFIWHHDEPVGSFAHYAGFILAKEIAKFNIKVVLNGQGADEILGGYWQQYLSYLFSIGKRGKLGTALGHIIGAIGHGGNSQLIRQILPMLQRYRARNTNQFTFTSAYEDLPNLNFYKNYFSMTSQERRLFDIRNLILPRLLKWDDRNLMAFGVEGRYPFLDHKLIETSLLFDNSVLFTNGWTKYPLRMSMLKKLPSEISYRKTKWGFETPQQLWLKDALRNIFSQWIKEDKPLDTVIPHENIINIANNFWRKGLIEDGQLLLRVFLLDQWFRVFSVRP